MHLPTTIQKRRGPLPPPRQPHLLLATLQGHREDTIHIKDSDGLNSGKEEYRADQRGPKIIIHQCYCSVPETCPNIDISGETASIDWTWSEILGPDNLAHDGNATAPIHTDSGDLQSEGKLGLYVENGRDRRERGEVN